MTDEDGKTGTASTSVTVANVAPQFSSADLQLSESTAFENDTVTLNGTVQRSGHARPAHRDDRLGRRLAADRALLDRSARSSRPGIPGQFTYSSAHQYLNNPPGVADRRQL